MTKTKTPTVMSSSTNSIFSLLKNELTDKVTYSATRSQIAKAFKGNSLDADLAIDYRVVGGASWTYRANIVLDKASKHIEIGCQTFDGKDYTKLRRWALAKSSK